ncbi:hypothetical protein JYU12_02085, partial [bacterium AH-315-K03]|nr:hypothetical protein [bacterium AH-315-K03]
WWSYCWFGGDSTQLISIPFFYLSCSREMAICASALVQVYLFLRLKIIKRLKISTLGVYCHN